jgi:pyruvate dehydrogenase E1 component alpha subunit
MKEAMEYARSGKGPILIEFVTWREGPHTTSDNPRIYRTEKEEEEAEKWEPFHRIEKYLNDKNILNKKELTPELKEQKEECINYFEGIK